MEPENQDTGIDKNMIRCNGCECAFVPEFEKQSKGDLELTLFRCPYCGYGYLVGATDEALRDSIREYNRLFQKNRKKRLTEQLQKRMQLLKASNLKRSEELKREFLLSIQEKQEI